MSLPADVCFDLISLSCAGCREKYATSEPEIRAEHSNKAMIIKKAINIPGVKPPVTFNKIKFTSNKRGSLSGTSNVDTINETNSDN